MQRKHPVLSVFHAVLPAVLLAVAVALLAVSGRLGQVAAAAAASFFGLGKLIILKGAITDNPFGMTTMEFAIMVFCMDCWTAYLLAYNLHRLYKVPKAGPWLERVQHFCAWWLHKHPWMRRWAFTGVMLFVFFPLTGTGAPGGTIMGRLVGLKPSATLLAIVLGAALGCLAIASFAAPLEPFFADVQGELWFRASGIVVILLVFGGIFFLGHRLSKAAKAWTEERPDSEKDLLERQVREADQPA